MKELPKVFHNQINKKINNNELIYYGNENKKENVEQKNQEKDKKTVLQKINEIFSSPNYIYKSNVEIFLKDKKISKKIIGRNKDYIITMDNELIKINDIIDIKAEKKWEFSFFLTYFKLFYCSISFAVKIARYNNSYKDTIITF